MNKYKINLIYKDDNSNIYDLIVNALTNELKNKRLNETSPCNYSFRENNREL